MDQPDIRSILLRGMADTIDLDLAVAPLVVVAEPGIEAMYAILDIAAGLGMRRRGMHPDDDLDNVDALTSVGSSVIVVEMREWKDADLVTALHHIVDNAGSEAIVALLADENDATVENEDAEGRAHRIVLAGMGHHRALYRTLLLNHEAPVSRVSIVGELETISSRIGERTVSIHVSEPYEHEATVVVAALPGQTDDDLTDILDRHREVAISAVCASGELSCTTDDIAALT